MIGSGQLVWGQGNIPVEVPINGYPGNNTLTKTIYTEHLNRGVFISELAYSADPTYPYGKLIELTTTTEFPSFDLSNYTIRLVCRCDGMSPNWLDYPASSLILLGGTAIMGQQQAQILSLENITYPSYTCTNPNLYIILYKNPVPTNLINNPLDFIGINENYIYPYYGVNVAHGIGLSVGQTYQRHDSGWIAENSTLGTVNTNLTTCDMYIMMYNTGLYSLIPTPNENYLTILMSSFCLPSQKNPLWYYHICNNDWASSTSLYTWTANNSYHDKNVRTVFFSGIKALDYFKNRHHFEAWGNTSSSYGLNNVFTRLSYQQEGTWQISNNEVRIIKEGATCVTVGHEMGHKVNNGSAPNSGAAPVSLPAWWDEGFVSDNNRFLQMQCNAYNGCQKDWYFDAQAKLDPQGECISIDASKALRNHFHYLPPGIIEGNPNYTHHLFIHNDNTYFTPTNKLTLRTDNSPQSLPTAINNVAIVDKQTCDAVLGSTSPIYNTSCAVDFPTDPWSGGCAWAGSGGNNANLQATIYRLLQTEETDSLLALLNCLNTDWAIRMLVGTYTDSRNFSQALDLLALLPNTPENTEFATIYTAIINELQGNTTGRTIPTKTILEKMAATQRRSQPNVLAETALASYFGYDYTRSFETEKTETAPTTLAKKSFSIVPNPTNSYFDLYLNSDSEQSQILSICDINGRLLQTVTINGQHSLVNVSHLPSGIYYCKLSNTSSVAKLVIIK